MPLTIPTPEIAARQRRVDLKIRGLTLLALAVVVAAAIGSAAPLALALAALLFAAGEAPLLAAARGLKTTTLARAAMFATSCFGGALATSLPFFLWLHGEVHVPGAVLLWSLLLAATLFDSHRLGRLRLAAAGPHALALAAAPAWSAYQAAGAMGAAASLFGSLTCLTLAGLLWTRREKAQAHVRAALRRAQTQEEFTSLLLEESPLSAALLDTNLVFLAASARYRRGKGLRPEDIIGRRYEEVVADAKPLWLQALRRSLRGETVSCEREELASLTGEQLYDRWETRPWRDADGRIKGVMIYSENITEFVQADARRRGAELRLEAALDSTKAAVWEIDFETKRVETDHRFRELLGEDPTYRLVCSAASVHPADRADVVRLIEAARITPGSYHLEHRIQRPDGAVRWVASTAQSLGVPKGHKGRIVIMSIDITDRKALELDFANAMERAEALLEDRRQSIDLLARETSQGPATTFARPTEPLPPAQAPGQSALQAFAELHRRLDRLLAEVDLRDRVLFQAVEGLRTARGLAQKASAAKTDFLANVSHELRTPLNAVIGYAEILWEEMSAEGRAQSAEDAQRILRAARQLLNLINGILDLSKIEAGRMDVSVVGVDVRRLAEECLELIAPAARERGNALRLNWAGEVGQIESDALKLRQCLLNLLSNANKFTDSGEIELTVRTAAGARIAFEVADTGCGMSADQLARLFQPFVQVDLNAGRRSQGTGLGLVISKRLAQLLGGDLSVQSAPGAGSKFTLEVAQKAKNLRDQMAA